MIKIDFELNTSGKGFWSPVAKTVKCVSMVAESLASDGDREFGELRVYFDTKSWDVSKHGLIYTDPAFLDALRAALNDFGFEPEAVDDVQYSEQGMQGDDYVSFDVCEDFLPEYRRMIMRAAA